MKKFLDPAFIGIGIKRNLCVLTPHEGSLLFWICKGISPLKNLFKNQDSFAAHFDVDSVPSLGILGNSREYSSRLQ